MALFYALQRREEMTLNNHSYCHKRVRLLCIQFESLSELKLATNLDEEFNDIRFMNGLSYVIIDYKHSKWFAMSYKPSKEEWETLKEIMIYCSWLYVGGKAQRKVLRHKRTKIK